MKSLFIPFVGTDIIQFGMSRSKVRETLNKGFKTFRRGPFATTATDFFEELGMFVEYDDADNCSAIEFDAGLGSLYYDNRELLRMRYSELRQLFDSSSSNNEEEKGKGIYYYDLGFAATRKTKDDNDEIESVSIFSRNYW